MKTFPKIIVLLICLLLPAIIFAQNNQEDNAPKIALKDINGKTVRLSDFKGKVILLNFLGNVVSRRAAPKFPELIKWQKEYESQGLQIIGITYPPSNRAKVRRFVRQNGINYPILFGTKKTKEIFTSADTMPFSVVIDRDGQIKERIEGIIYAEEFDETIKPLLESDSKRKAAEIQ